MCEFKYKYVLCYYICRHISAECTDSHTYIHMCTHIHSIGEYHFDLALKCSERLNMEKKCSLLHWPCNYYKCRQTYWIKRKTK